MSCWGYHTAQGLTPDLWRRTQEAGILESSQCPSPTWSPVALPRGPSVIAGCPADWPQMGASGFAEVVQAGRPAERAQV